jgi:hypothetical protein
VLIFQLFSGTYCILCISTFQIPVDDTVQLDKIRKERNYTYEDQVECSREKLPNYDEQVRRNSPVHRSVVEINYQEKVR